jgi:hypothetical protein
LIKDIWDIFQGLSITIRWPIKRNTYVIIWNIRWKLKINPVCTGQYFKKLRTESKNEKKSLDIKYARLLGWKANLSVRSHLSLHINGCLNIILSSYNTNVRLSWKHSQPRECKIHDLFSSLVTPIRRVDENRKFMFLSPSFMVEICLLNEAYFCFIFLSLAPTILCFELQKFARLWLCCWKSWIEIYVSTVIHPFLMLFHAFQRRQRLADVFIVDRKLLTVFLFKLVGSVVG